MLLPGCYFVGASSLGGYRLDDLLLFSPEVYFSSLRFYNESIFPAQLLGVGGGLLLLIAVYLLRRLAKGHAMPKAGQLQANAAALSGLILAAGWFVTGVLYQLPFYQQINWMAYYYGWLFIVEGALLFGWALLLFLAPKSSAPPHGPPAAWGVGFGLIIGAVFMLPFFGLVEAFLGLEGAGQTLIDREAGSFLTEPFKAGLYFALSPLPTLMATVGFALTYWRVPHSLMVLPVVYCVIGGLTAYVLGSLQLFVYAAMLGLLLITGVFKLYARLAHCWLARA